jgi:hypothetical protein
LLLFTNKRYALYSTEHKMQNAALEEARHPISGIDYPGTFQDFDKRFSSENARLEYIAKLRWPKWFIWPACGEKTEQPSLMERGLFLC